MPNPFATQTYLLWTSNPTGANGPGQQQGASPVPTAAQLAAGPVTLGPFDVNGMIALQAIVAFGSFTGGTAPTWAPELDLVLDDGILTPDKIPLWTPAAATAATKWLFLAGAGHGTAPTITGWVVASIQTDFGNTVQLLLTPGGTALPTAINGAVILLYGKRGH